MKTFLCKSSARTSGLRIGQRAAALCGAFFLIIGCLLTGCPSPTNSKPKSVDKTALAAAITLAESDIGSVAVSTDGSDVLPAAKWVTAANKTDYQSAIDAAKAVNDNAAATQAQVDDAKTALDGAVAAFGAAKKAGTKQSGGPADKTALAAAITLAETDIGSVTESADGTDILPPAQWVTPAAKADYQSAIDAAKTVNADAAATQAQADGAKTALDTAVAAFSAAKGTGTGTLPADIDRTALRAAISQAEVNIDSVTVSTDGTDVLPAAQWVTAAVKTAYQNAINTAKGVDSHIAATQDQVDEAKTALDGATSAFDGAKQNGTGEDTSGVDRTALAAAITAAESAISLITVSADGNDILPAAQWVTAAAKADYQAAITAAKGVNSHIAATQEQVDGAKTALDTAASAFNTAKKSGNTADRTELTQKIAEAQNHLDTAERSTDGSDVWVDETWVSEAVYDAYQGAITGAIAVRDAEAAAVTVNQVNNALAALAAKKTAFDNDKKAGTSAANKTALNTALSSAQTARDGTPVSTDGYDVLTTKSWVTQAVKDALAAAITAAEAVAHDAGAEQDEVDAAVTALNGALGTFNGAKQAGKKVPGTVKYTFSGLPQDQTITLSNAGAVSWASDQSLAVSVTETFEAYQWYRDGEAVAGATGTSITLRARTLRIGAHTLTLKVKKAGVWYTKTLGFTVN